MSVLIGHCAGHSNYRPTGNRQASRPRRDRHLGVTVSKRDRDYNPEQQILKLKLASRSASSRSLSVCVALCIKVSACLGFFHFSAAKFRLLIFLQNMSSDVFLHKDVYFGRFEKQVLKFRTF